MTVSRSTPPAAGWTARRVLAIFGTVGLCAALRDRIEWYDASVEVLVSELHTRFGVHGARMVSDIGPYLGAAMVLVALWIARRRGARPAEILRPLAALGVALLYVELLKLAVFRERPFSLGPAQHDSFPSGDTAQVALCAATALHLVALRRIADDWLRPGMAVVGATTAVAIALSRVYLGRHWISDVVASLVIGLVFWSAAPRLPFSVRKLALVVTAIVVTVMSGPSLVLPSPMAFDDEIHFELPVVAGGSADDGHHQGATSWRFRTAAAGYSLLQLELVPAANDANADYWLDLELDRDPAASVPLAAHRSIYALPLPRLTSGLHEVRLRARKGGAGIKFRSFTLARVSIEGAVGQVAREDGDSATRDAEQGAPREALLGVVTGESAR